mmetsp:Transcript_28912/g.79662  ORF Transcript_28912/g.79662 Transcript_28912/m.79662 type:complete len:542 (+) Transcript_28912:109-1734(+)
MGVGAGKNGLEEAINRTKRRSGTINTSGRYHKLPKRLGDDYKIMPQVIGSGYNGEVFMAERFVGRTKYAVKGFKLNGVTKDKKAELATECEIFLSMDHPHVARLVDVYEDEERLTLVMECMTGGELFHRVMERKRFTEKDACDAVLQMLLAINYIHSHGIVHRDLKLENFLYESTDSDHLKLIDFGFSKIWAPNTKMALSCGTLAYVAPEVIGKEYTSKCDLWSLGVIVFILLSGYMPFHGSESAQVRNIRAGKYAVRPEKWKSVSEQALGFVKALLVVDPEERLSAEEAMHHPWVAAREKEAFSRESCVDNDVVDALCSFGKASAFRRACLNMMAWSLSNEERKKVRNAFLEMDRDKSGCIKLWEFKKVLEDRFHVSDEQAMATFSALDANNTDEIHYSEFLAAMCSTRIALHDDLLKQTFRRFDTDNSGFITASNLKEVLGEAFEGQQVEHLLAEADVTRDGRISLEEFLNYMKHPALSETHRDAAAVIIDKGIHSGGKDTTQRLVLKGAMGTVDEATAGVKLEEKQRSKPTSCNCSIL